MYDDGDNWPSSAQYSGTSSLRKSEAQRLKRTDAVPGTASRTQRRFILELAEAARGAFNPGGHMLRINRTRVARLSVINGCILPPASRQSQNLTHQSVFRGLESPTYQP